jgi:HPt (histidine-containing phosphotransfer) domain-containing protein
MPVPELSAADKTAALIQALWERNLPQLRERLDLLDHAAAQAGAGTLANDTRLEAAAIAHKLAGSLGMFGYKDGTTIARELESLFNEADQANMADQAAALTRSLRTTLSLN